MCIKKLFCKHRSITFMYALPEQEKDGKLVKGAAFKCNHCGKVIFRYTVLEKEEK